MHRTAYKLIDTCIKFDGLFYADAHPELPPMVANNNNGLLFVFSVSRSRSRRRPFVFFSCQSNQAPQFLPRVRSLYPPMASFTGAPLRTGCHLAAAAAYDPEPLSHLSVNKVEALKIERWPAKLVKCSERLRIMTSFQKGSVSTNEVSKVAYRKSQELTKSEANKLEEGEQDLDPFDELKHRFKTFKEQKYLDDLAHYQNLAEVQSPKFMVIACADSRVCPSTILGFQPGEAFTVRNVGNLVPPFQHGPTETNAALEFAVNSLEVENIFVIGHSRCGGIRALMSMNGNGDPRSLIREWVSIGINVRLNTIAAAGNLSFDMQCRHCEKESINNSLLNLMTYPWIEKRVTEGKLSLHGGYYDFVNCTFEKWTLVHREEDSEGDSRYAIENHSIWS